MAQLQRRLVGAAFAALCLLAPAAGHAAGDRGDRLALGLGWYDILHTNDAVAFSGEYRFAPVWWLVRPMAGLMVNTDNSVFGYAGLLVDLPVWHGFHVIPSLAMGGYGQGDGKDLGGPFEFGSTIEVAYQFKNRVQIGVSLKHISNAGLRDPNPGTEIVMLRYTIPLER